MAAAHLPELPGHGGVPLAAGHLQHVLASDHRSLAQAAAAPAAAQQLAPGQCGVSCETCHRLLLH